MHCGSTDRMLSPRRVVTIQTDLNLWMVAAICCGRLTREPVYHRDLSQRTFSPFYLFVHLFAFVL